MSNALVERREYGSKLDVLYVDVGGGKFVPVSESPLYGWKFEPDAEGDPIYAGCADPGTAVSEAKWRIRKFLYSGTGDAKGVTDVLWAGGTAEHDKVWNDRATYVYS